MRGDRNYKITALFNVRPDLFFFFILLIAHLRGVLSRRDDRIALSERTTSAVTRLKHRLFVSQEMRKILLGPTTRVGIFNKS
jgi:hypothetical protein